VANMASGVAVQL